MSDGSDDEGGVLLTLVGFGLIFGGVGAVGFLAGVLVGSTGLSRVGLQLNLLCALVTAPLFTLEFATDRGETATSAVKTTGAMFAGYVVVLTVVVGVTSVRHGVAEWVQGILLVSVLGLASILAAGGLYGLLTNPFGVVSGVGYGCYYFVDRVLWQTLLAVGGYVANRGSDDSGSRRDSGSDRSSVGSGSRESAGDTAGPDSVFDPPTAEELGDGEPTVVDEAAAAAARAAECWKFEERRSKNGWAYFRAVSFETGGPVAVAVADPSFDRDGFEGALRDGLATWSNVGTHPNALELSDWSLDPWPWCVLATPPRSDTLRDARADLSTAELLSVVDGISDVVHTAQRYNRHHGGLKPSRIVVGPEDDRGDVTVFGWGVFEVIARGSGQARRLSFRPPEQLDDPHRGGPATDVYRLGAVTYWGLTGERPFAVEESLETAIREGRRIPVTDRDPSLPDALDNVLHTALATDPADRHDSVREFADALERAAAPIRESA